MHMLTFVSMYFPFQGEHRFMPGGDIGSRVLQLAVASQDIDQSSPCSAFALTSAYALRSARCQRICCSYVRIRYTCE